MIAFLTLLYIGVLYLLVRFKLVPWNTFWKISPAIWLVLLFVVLFIPMNWGAPSGPVVILRHSVAIVPNVAGEVIDVPVEPNGQLKAGDVLFRIDPTPYEAQVRQIEAQLKLAQLNLERAKELQQRNAGTLATLQQRQAELDSLNAQLDAAKWNLAKTVVRAPANGYVTNVALRKGARVAAVPVAPVMAFIETDDTAAAILINQIYARHIMPRQPVELTFKFLPGKVYTGHVDALIQATSRGQVQVSGNAATPVAVQPLPFVVRVTLDDPTVAASLPAGTVGEAAIYTGSAKATHIIRRVMIRMSTFLNYVLPF
jgi:RND family efflux transporter MFP subunit